MSDPGPTVRVPEIPSVSGAGSNAPGGPAAPPTRIGPYTLLGELGHGGMGVVFRAEDPQLKREVALKVMLPQFASDSQAKTRFVREARAQAKVEHDHVAAIYQVSDHDGLPYIVMPLLKGMTLHAALKANPRPPIPEVIRIGREMAEGLAAAHEQGLVHRDIKPANVWLEGKRLRVKVLDFGLARVASGSEAADASSGPVTQQGMVVGTPAYMSPEQGRGLAVDGRTDLWSLGVVLYQMTTGELPFTGPTALAILTSLALDEPVPPIVRNPSVPPALSDWILRLLAKDPANRPPTAEVAVAELRSVEAGLVNAVRVIPLDAPPPIILSHPSHPSQFVPDPFADLDATESNTVPDAVPVPDTSSTTGQPVSENESGARREIPAWAIVVTTAVVAGGIGVAAALVQNRKSEPVQESLKPQQPPPAQKLSPSPGELLALRYGSPEVEMRFHWVPPGRFSRGTPPRDVTVSKGFWMAETECTQAQWRAVMKANPDPSHFKGDNLPVEKVTAADAEAFCTELATAVGRPIRLPTEAEWEYACRAGTRTDYHTGDGPDSLRRAGWFGEGEGGSSHPVGRLEPNAWGLKDMHGNVWEWCRDGYDANYFAAAPGVDPVNESPPGSDRVIRGGSWYGPAENCLSANRKPIAPGFSDHSIGVRPCFRP